MKINKSKLMKKAWDIARTAVESFGGKVREYFSESLKKAWKIMKMKKIVNSVNIGDVFHIGIGHGESVDATVVKIQKDFTNGDMAHLRMNDFGGPIQKVLVNYLLATQN